MACGCNRCTNTSTQTSTRSSMVEQIPFTSQCPGGCLVVDANGIRCSNSCGSVLGTSTSCGCRNSCGCNSNSCGCSNNNCGCIGWPGCWAR